MENGKTLASAAVLSVLINGWILSEVPQLGRTPVSAPIPPKVEKQVLFNLNTPKNFKYIDTPEISRKPERTPDQISDKDSRADSSRMGTDQGIVPESVYKDRINQAQRFSNLPQTPPVEAMKKMEKAIQKMEKKQKQEELKSALENKISVIEKQKTKSEKNEETISEEEELEKISETHVALNTPPSPSTPPSEKEDLFPLPMISIGNRNYSEKGLDAFDASSSEVGKYVKKMRDKIGLRFNQMVFFHYKTSSISESRVNIAFDILKDGRVKNVQKENVFGDPLFAEYCETVVVNAAPFSHFTKDLDPFLEEGVLKMNILFGYNVREKEAAGK